MKSKINKKEFYLIVILFLVAFILRIIKFKQNEVFIIDDEVRFVLASIDAFKIFTLNESGLHILRLFSYAWGPMTIVLNFIYMFFLNLFQIPFTEKSLTFFPVFIGSFSPIILYYLVKEIYQEHRISFLAGLLLAVIPVHVTHSRSLGGFGLIGSFLFMFTILFFLKFIKTKKFKFGLFSSIALGIYIGTSSQFLGIFPLLILIIGIFQREETFFSKLRLLYRPSFYLPFLIIPSPIFASWLYYLIFRNNPAFGMFGHIVSRSKSFMFHSSFFSNIYFSVGLVLAILFIIVFLYTIIKGYMSFKEKHSYGSELFLISWSFIYLFPWLFLVNSRGGATYIYYITGIIPLLILTSVFFFEIKKKINKKHHLFYNFAVLLIVFITIFYSINVVYGMPFLKVTENRYYGRIANNLGTKTAGYYIREYTNESSNIFSEYGFFSAKYFYHRNTVANPDLFLSFHSSSSKDKLKFFRNFKDKIDYVVLTSNTMPLFEKDLSKFHKIVIIRSESRPISFIYARNKKELRIMDVEKYDRLFNIKYGNWKSLYVDCYFCLGDPIIKI